MERARYVIRECGRIYESIEYDFWAVEFLIVGTRPELPPEFSLVLPSSQTAAFLPLVVRPVFFELGQVVVNGWICSLESRACDALGSGPRA